MSDRITLATIAQRLDTLGRGERTAFIEREAAFYGVAASTMWDRLRREVGWSSGRKARSDKGKTKVPEAAMMLASALSREGIRKNGKSTMALTTANSILVANDVQTGVTVDHLQRVLRARGLDRASQTRDSAHVTMRAPHPNFLHQVDPSLCVVYYLKGEQRIMREDEFYKNKLENFAKVKFKTWRYSLWDAASSAPKFRYYQAAGETQINLAEFILWAWATGERKAPYGVPLHLGLDPGSANTAHAIKALCEALEVKLIVHMPGAARVSGGVEGTQNLIETQFESRLRFEPVETCEQLNAAADAWCNAWNENLIPGMDCRLHRRGVTIGARADLWRLIKAEQLRFLPPIEVCRALMEGRTIERKVGSGLTITFKHPQARTVRRYMVAGIDGLSVGDTVSVSPLVYGDCSVRIRVKIYNGEDRVYRIEPEAQLDQFGQPSDAPVWGETYASLPDTISDKAGKAIDRLAFPGLDEDGIRKARNKNTTPLLGVLDGKNLNAHSHLKNIVQPSTLPKRGETISVPDHVSVAPAVPLTHFASCKAIVALLQRPLTVDENAQVRAWYPDGVLEDNVPMVAQCVANGTTPFNAGRVLKVAS